MKHIKKKYNKKKYNQSKVFPQYYPNLLWNKYIKKICGVYERTSTHTYIHDK